MWAVSSRVFPFNLCANSRQAAPSLVQPYTVGTSAGNTVEGHPDQGGALFCPPLSPFVEENCLLLRCLQGLEDIRHDSNLSLQWPKAAQINLKAQLMLCRWLALPHVPRVLHRLHTQQQNHRAMAHDVVLDRRGSRRMQPWKTLS